MDSWRKATTAWFRKTWSENLGVIAAISAIVCVGLFALAILQAIAVSRKYPLIEWGSVAEAFGAVGTLLAFLVAGAVWRHDVHNRRRDEQARAEDELRRQAEAISCWPEYRDQSQTSVIGLINASQSVIYDVEIRTIYDGRKDEPGFAELKLNWLSHAYVGTLPPGAWFIDVLSTNEPTTVEVYFRDNRGNTWQLDNRGKLEPASEPFFAIPSLVEIPVVPPDPWPGVGWNWYRKYDYVYLQRPKRRNTVHANAAGTRSPTFASHRLRSSRAERLRLRRPGRQ